MPLEDMVKDSGRVQQLQRDEQTLLTQAAKNDANLVALRERLGWHSELHSEPASSHYESTGGDTIAAGALKAVKTAPAQASTTPPKQKASLDVNRIEMDEWDWPKTGKERLGGQ